MEKSSASVLKGMQNYSVKLASEEWKSYSKRMREQKGNFCQICRSSSKDRILQVHHIFYESGRDPWEYTAEEVAVLCDSCHHQIHDELKKFRKHVFGHMTPVILRTLNGALRVGLTSYDPLTYVHALAEFTASPRAIINFSKSWTAGTTPSISS